MLEIACVVKTGKRPTNDDRAVVNDVVVAQGLHYAKSDEACLAIVCDGVGGEAYGCKAAEIVTEYFSRVFDEKMTMKRIEEHIAKANAEVSSIQRTERKYSKMKTTISGIYICGDDCITFNMGDSRIYRYRAYLYQMSTDHSQKQDLIDLGLIPKPGAENVITRCIGSDNTTPDIIERIGRVFQNDTYIICTDGVWGVLDDNDFESVLSQEKRISEAAQSLVELAVKKESQDNLSIIIIRRV